MDIATTFFILKVLIVIDFRANYIKLTKNIDIVYFDVKRNEQFIGKSSS
jgi:hypothetical protein